MKIINPNYIAVEKLEEPKVEGFQTVQVQDSSTYKGKIKYIPNDWVSTNLQLLNIGDIILFAKYSPDTHDIDLDGEKLKFVKISDILAIL